MQTPTKEKKVKSTTSKILEKDITKQIKIYLKEHNIFHWKVWQGLGSTPGVPDIIAIINGMFVGIEVKKPGGKLSDNQAKFAENIINNGGRFMVVSSLEQLKHEL